MYNIHTRVVCGYMCKVNSVWFFGGKVLVNMKNSSKKDTRVKMYDVWWTLDQYSSENSKLWWIRNPLPLRMDILFMLGTSWSLVPLFLVWIMYNVRNTILYGKKYIFRKPLNVGWIICDVIVLFGRSVSSRVMFCFVVFFFILFHWFRRKNLDMKDFTHIHILEYLWRLCNYTHTYIILLKKCSK